MRLAALFVAVLPLMSLPCLAQTAPVVSVTPVSYALDAATQDNVPDRGFPGQGVRDVGFEIGRPERPDLELTSAKPRATARMAAQRVKKPFQVPWQTGIFQ